MWYHLGVILSSLYLIPSLLQRFRGKPVGNERKTEEESEKQEIRHWYRLGIRDLLTAIAKALTVQLGMSNYECSYQMSKLWGPMFSAIIPTVRRQMGSINGNLDICKKMMGSGTAWPDRLYDNHYMHTATFNKPLGLLFGTGEHYKRANRLTLKLLHQFEFFKPSRMESFITFEITEIEANLQKHITQHGGEYTFSTHGMFQVATLNNVWLLIAGRRFAYDDPTVHEMLDSWNKANREQSIGFTMLEILPFLKYFPRLTFLQSTQHMSNIIYDHMRERIREMREEWETLSYHEVDPTNLMEGFLREVDKPENKNDPYLTEENMLAVMRDMVLAGGDTVNNAIEFALFHMAQEPEIQARVRDEIDQIIGSSGTPSYTDKDRMPYTQAVLQEVLRIASPVPITGRSAATDADVGGLKVTKGDFIAVNIYALHRDESVWEDPLAFKPERFINGAGKLVNFDKTLAFGYGKRSCTGESVARVSLFIFFVTLMQRFTFELSRKHCSPSQENVVGLTRCPQPHFVTVRRREQLALP